MILEFQKPTQSDRHGEGAEGLPGSIKSVACVKRNSRELGRPSWFLPRQVSEADQKIGELKTSWESDQLTVLSERESRSQGEGADGNTKPAKETLSVQMARSNSANLPVGNSEEELMCHQSGRVACPESSCGSEYSRRARCGKIARRDLCGGCRVTGSPTAIAAEAGGV